MYNYILLLLILTISADNVLAQENIIINIDFAGSSSDLPWNNVNHSQVGQLADLTNQFGQSTGISIEINDPFNGENTNGTQTANPNLEIPDTASGDSFFGNREEFANKIEATGGVLLTGLDPTKFYDLSLFASRIASDNRETQYNISGLTKDTLYLNVADNINEIAKLDQLQPSNEGTIEIQATTGPNNTNAFGFFYLGALRLEFEDILIPLDSLLVLTAPTGNEFWQTNKTPEIRWISQNIQEVILEYSADLGASWQLIDTVNAFAQKFDWVIPNINSTDCLVRIRSGQLSDSSPLSFEITNLDSSSCHIVVLGSSTAAGTGPTSQDSAWVWMYEDFLFQKDTRFDITNLARGGFTTYHILPDGSPIPSNFNITVDTSRNITRALSLNPNAIIINLPSNDAANSISVATQLENYDLILDRVVSDTIPFWICTPQPRNGFSEIQRAIQEDMRDSTISIFPTNNIDFWTEIADDNSMVKDIYNSGDGVHLNNAGHRLLLERVLGASIDSFLLNQKYIAEQICPDWFVSDYNWTYRFFAPFSTSGYGQMELSGDTTILNQSCKVLTNYITAIDQADGDSVITSQKYIVYQNDKQVYLLNEDQMQFNLIYDFNLEIGDDIVYYQTDFNEFCMDSVVYKLDSLSSFVFDSKKLTIQHFSFYDHFWDFSGEKTVIETIGVVEGGFQHIVESHPCLTDGLGFELCSVENSKDFYKFSTEDCFSLPSNTKDEEIYWRIYPNPTSNKITIEGIDPPFDYWIFDSFGQLVQSQKGELKNELHIKSKGLLFLIIEQSNLRSNHKIIRE